MAGLGYEELEALRPAVAKDGLRAELRGRPLAVLAEQIVELARAALVRRGITRADGRDESVHLESLVRLAASARCPADDLLEAYRAHPEPGPAAVLAALRAHVLVAG